MPERSPTPAPRFAVARDVFFAPSRYEPDDAPLDYTTGPLPPLTNTLSLLWHPSDPDVVDLRVPGDDEVYKIRLQVLRDGITGPATQHDVFVAPLHLLGDFVDQRHEIVLDPGRRSRLGLQVHSISLAAFVDDVLGELVKKVEVRP